MKKVIANNPVRIAVLLWRLIIKASKKGINPVNARNTGNEKNEPNKMPVIQPQHRHIRYNDAGPSYLIHNQKRLHIFEFAHK